MEANEGESGIRVAFFLNLGFAILELFGGMWVNSMAILSDALHDAGDSLSLGLAWYLERYSHKGRDVRYSYGYRRFSLLGALANAIILITGGLWMLSAAIPRLLHPEPANAPGMALFAVVGIVINGAAALRAKSDKTLNAQVVVWHLLEDVLGWVAVLIVSFVLWFTDLEILDPLLSILITLYILYNVTGNLRKTLSLFLQAVPEDVDVAQIERQLQDIAGVQSSHHTHVWSLDGKHHVLSTHLVIAADAGREEILRIKRTVHAAIATLDCEHTTIEIEYADEECGLKG